MTLDRRTLLKHAAAIGALSMSTPAAAESASDMTHVFSAAEIDRQLPIGDEIFLDHVGHFVRDPEAASRALGRAGFAPTPISVQVNPDPAGGAPRPTGTGNVTAMLRRGYLEMLFKTADTPLGRELDEALARYAGVHLAAFAVADAAKAHARLTEAGFKTRPLVQMERPVATESGTGKAAFTVARVEPGAMAEGRIQILTHRTPLGPGDHARARPRAARHHRRDRRHPAAHAQIGLALHGRLRRRGRLARCGAGQAARRRP